MTILADLAGLLFLALMAVNAVFLLVTGQLGENP